MSKRESIESKIVQYFNEAPFNVAQTVFGIIKGAMKSRAAENDPLAQIQTMMGGKVRKARAKKVKSNPPNQESKSTSFPGEIGSGNAA
jgi:hypothetical protein